MKEVGSRYHLHFGSGKQLFPQMLFSSFCFYLESSEIKITVMWQSNQKLTFPKRKTYRIHAEKFNRSIFRPGLIFLLIIISDSEDKSRDIASQ